MGLRRAMRLAGDPTKIVTPRYREWLRNHSDDPYPDWVVELMRKELQKVQRDRRGSFSGSSAGSCLRAQELGYLGVIPPLEAQPTTDLLSIFDDGRWRHLRWQANLLSAAILGRIEVSLSWPAKRSAGSMDGAGIVPDDHPNPRWRGLEFGFELKGMNGFQFSRLIRSRNPQPTDKHLHQVDRYLLASGFDLFVVLYECKATQATYEWVIERDEERIAESLEELEALNEAVDMKMMHPQLMSCSKRMGPYWDGCPYAGRGGICEQWRDQGRRWA
jgi:hypothetical protein